MGETEWPPKSPRAAMLSSPSGRRKYEDMQRRRENMSPLKRSSTTPNIRSKAAQILEEDEEMDEDDEEDEETLALKLEEIKARLKLKQLQKNRGRSDSNQSNARPSSAISSTSSRLQEVQRSPRGEKRKAGADGVQVPVSPTKREVPAAHVASPRRYLMGIDKGWKASDVSLKRAPRNDQLGRRPSDLSSPAGLSKIKSFSERMAEGRAAEKSRMERAEKLQANRSSGFQLDKGEIEAFKTAAAETKPSPPPSAARDRQVESFSREDILRSLGQSRPLGIKRSQTTPNVRRTENNSDDSQGRSQLHKRNHTAESETVSSTHEEEAKSPDPSKFESYSSLHLSTRILPQSFLSRNLASKTIFRIPDLLKIVKAPAFELPEEVDGDFVVFGIVASKSSPRDIKRSGNATAKEADPYDDGRNNTNRYMAITLTDLKWTIDLFLFDTAFPRYYKISEGTLIAILNPTIMPPPKHKLDTNRFSLALSSSDDKVLEIGHARDIGFCKAVRKDGKTCQTWVDGRKTEFCDFHVDVQVRRTQGHRSGVNSGSGTYGPGGRSGSRTGFFGSEGGSKKGDGRGGDASKQGLKQEGPQYHWGTQSTYYLAPAPKNRGAGRSSFNPVAAGQSAANLLDNVSDDPFIAAGMMGRGTDSKEERLRKRLATQQRERDITEKLFSNRVGGVGAEYLRKRTANAETSKDAQDETPGGTPSTPKLPSSNASALNLSSFGKAQNVRLSPMKRARDKPHGSGVKKTRFITAKGIREAGRDSLGGPSEADPASNPFSDTDDDLDIV